MHKRISPRRDAVLKEEDRLLDVALDNSHEDVPERVTSFDSPKKLLSNSLSSTPTKSVRTSIERAGSDLREQEKMLSTIIGWTFYLEIPNL